MKKTCILVFGKFNPVHIGHGKVFDYANQLQKNTNNSDFKLYITNTESNCILDYEYKCNMIIDYYPYLEQNIVKEHPNSLFGVLENLDDSYDNIIIVSGYDRTEYFKKIIEKYNNILYHYDNITSKCAGFRGLNPYSSTNVRKTIMNNNFGEFCSLMPVGSYGKNKKYFNELREIMK